MSDIKDFAYKLIVSNRKTLPKFEVHLECSLNKNNEYLPQVDFVALHLDFETEHNGDPKHVLKDTDDYDPEYMKCRVRASILLYDLVPIKIYENVVYTRMPLLEDTTPDDIMDAIEEQTRDFILPKFVELHISISKDDWSQA